MKYPKFYWNKNIDTCVCTIKYENKLFTGTAQCHPDDEDMKSKLTGEIIAELRANIASLTYQRDYELLPQLKALKQLYYSINQNKDFNPKSIEAKALYRYIKRTEDELSMAKDIIKDLKLELKTYIDTKEKFYQEIRRKRKLNS